MTDLERIKKDVVEMGSRANVCWYDTKVLTKAVRLILEELTADRKTEKSSEKPNNCETCKHYKLTCDLFSEICKYEPKDEPTISKTEQVDEPERHMAEDIVESFGFKAESYRQAKAKTEQTEREGE